MLIWVLIRTVDWIPEEDSARLDPPAHLIDPLIIEGHPVRLVLDLAWFNPFPELRRAAILDAVVC